MMAFLLGAATGYVLGARAGRERYEQITRTYHRVTDHPAVQSAAGVARQKVSGVVTSKIKPLRNGRVDTRPASTPPTSTPSATTTGTTTSATTPSATTTTRTTTTPRA
jgi:hypothetical protein